MELVLEGGDETVDWQVCLDITNVAGSIRQLEEGNGAELFLLLELVIVKVF